MRTEKDFERFLENIRQMAQEEGSGELDSTYVEHLKCRFFAEDVIIGENKRVLLREMKLSDLDEFYAFEDAKEESALEAFLKSSPEESRLNMEAYITYMYPLYEYGMWTVVEKNSGQVIGICGLDHPKEGLTECTDLGYYICPKCRKQGLAAECIEIVLDYAKNYLEFPLICAIIKEENRISERLLQKFGFVRQRDAEVAGKKATVYEKELKE